MSYTDGASRIITPDGDYPYGDFSNIPMIKWKSSASQKYDALVINNLVVTNMQYTGPCYVTWATRRTAVSQFKIVVDGYYKKISVKLVGLEDAFPNAPLGWLDLGTLYDGYGTPANGSNGNGCAVGVPANGSSGTFVCTFGQQSSSLATNNVILVRVRLEGLDELRSLSFQGMLANPDILW